MKLTKTKMQPYQINLICDCNEGNMLATGRAASSPQGPQYEHLCSKCKKGLSIIGKQYPIIAWEAISQPEDLEANINVQNFITVPALSQKAAKKILLANSIQLSSKAARNKFGKN